MVTRPLFVTQVYEASLAADRGFDAFRGDLADTCAMLAAEDKAGRAWCKANAYGGPAPAPVKPKLILAISVDQFSSNLYDDWRSQYAAGLGRLSQGVIYTSGYQTHASTETCPGHSTLLTGKHPNKTGIVANAYKDPVTGKPVYCVNDPSVVLAHDPKAQPVGPCLLYTSPSPRDS